MVAVQEQPDTKAVAVYPTVMPPMENKYDTYQGMYARHQTGDNRYDVERCICGGGVYSSRMSYALTPAERKAKAEYHATENPNNGWPEAEKLIAAYQIEATNLSAANPCRCTDRKAAPRIVYLPYSSNPVSVVNIFIMDLDGVNEGIRVRRYDRRVQRVTDGLSFETHPKGQLYLTENGPEGFIVSRKTKEDELKYTVKRVLTQEAVVTFIRTGSETEFSRRVYISDELENHPVYIRTGLKEFMETEKNQRSERDYMTSGMMFYFYQRENKSAEQLVKAGYQRYTKEAMIKNKKLSPALKEELAVPSFMKKNLKTMSEFDVARTVSLHKNGNMISEDLYEFIRTHSSWGNPVLTIMNNLVDEHGFTCGEIHGYLVRGWTNQALSPTDLLIYWNDTLRMAKTMELQVPRMPPDLRRTHDVLVRDFKFIEDKALNDMYQNKTGPALKKAYSFSYEGYHVRPPEDLGEIPQEGRALRHCVASYAKQVAMSQTAILFIRKDEEPDIPFVTAEVRNGILFQCNGLSNRRYVSMQDKQLVKFVDQWCKVKGIAKTR